MPLTRKVRRYNRGTILNLKRGDKVIASIGARVDRQPLTTGLASTSDGQIIFSCGAHGVLASYDLKGQRLGDLIGSEGKPSGR